jgi:hypothetical protein
MWKAILRVSVSVLQAARTGRQTRETLMTRTTVQRHTASIKLHRGVSIAAVTGLVGAVLTVTLGSASAMPGREDPPPVPIPAVHIHHGDGHYIAHGCFITPPTVDRGAADALPVCYTYRP